MAARVIGPGSPSTSMPVKPSRRCARRTISTGLSPAPSDGAIGTGMGVSPSKLPVLYQRSNASAEQASRFISTLPETPESPPLSVHCQINQQLRQSGSGEPSHIESRGDAVAEPGYCAYQRGQ